MRKEGNLTGPNPRTQNHFPLLNFCGLVSLTCPPTLTPAVVCFQQKGDALGSGSPALTPVRVT